MKTLIIIILTIGLASCSFIKQAETYVQKHCPESHVTNPLTGDIEIHYECDSLYNTIALNTACKQFNLCFDASNGRITGDVVCDSLFNLTNLTILKRKK